MALPLLVDGAGDGVLPKADAVLADLDRLNLGLAHFATDERQRESLRLRSRPSVATGGDGLGCSRAGLVHLLLVGNGHSCSDSG